MTEWRSNSNFRDHPIDAYEQRLAWSPSEFEEKLREKVAHYHTRHPFHKAMIDGRLNKNQIQGWVANRFYYQLTIPKKDAAIIANSSCRDFRRQWIRRIIDQDGTEIQEGGLEGWLRLGEACGLSRDEMLSLKHVQAGTRFACDAYLNFAKQAPWQEAVCSSLTELFAPNAHKERIASFPKHYPWIEEKGLQYFKDRLKIVEVDVKHGLRITLDYFNTAPLQERALQILGFKMDILWEILNAVQTAYGIGDQKL
jgi:pyrroloquinoline-quinone synthase